MHDFDLEILTSPSLGATSPDVTRSTDSDSIGLIEIRLQSWTVRLGGVWIEEEGDRERMDRRFRAGNWPESPGLFVEISPAGWKVVSDHASVATLFLRSGGARGSGEPLVSTRFSSVLPSGEVEISSEVIEDVVLLGHVLGRGTLARGVERVVQGEAVSGDSGGRIQLVQDSRSDPLAVVPDESAFRTPPRGPIFDHAKDLSVELTGGLDSRLSLGMFMAAGATPGFACTFGSAASPDVKIASMLATRFGINHRRLELSFDGEDAIRMGGNHVLATGGLLSLTKYAPLMPGLRGASEWRRGQISGMGGELGINFYSIPGMDQVTKAGNFAPVISRRMIQIPPAVVAAVGQGQEAVRSRVSGTIHDLVQGYGQDHGAALRTFYVRERMCNWGFIGLNANRYEYDLALPLLSHQYLAWANALTMEQRQGRLAQVALLRDFDSVRGDGFRLEEVKTADSSRGIGNVIRLAKKGIQKFVFGQDPRGGQGAAGIFSAAMDCPDLAEALESLEQLTVFGRHFNRQQLAENADSTGNLAGMFLSAAVVKCARSDAWFPARRPA